jgi:aconitate hydratase 2/2-methylisocitrate dehydratase
MGNQAQVKEGATVMSTSTRNFPNRLGKNTQVYLGSAELSAICSKLGRIPTQAEYLADMGVINADGSKIYKYLNFDQIAEYQTPNFIVLAKRARSGPFLFSLCRFA